MSRKRSWVRHPIYTGLPDMYAGTAIVSGEWHALVGLVLALVAYARKIRLGEANLVRRLARIMRGIRGRPER